MSVGNCTPWISKGCRTLHLQPKFSGTSFSNKEGPDRLLSPESVLSRGGTFVQPSETPCTHVHGLQVAVAVGLEGDPLGRNILGLPASVPVMMAVAEVVGIVEVMAVVRSVATVGTSSGSSDITTLFCHLLRQEVPSQCQGILLACFFCPQNSSRGSTCLVLCSLESLLGTVFTEV